MLGIGLLQSTVLGRQEEVPPIMPSAVSGSAMNDSGGSPNAWQGAGSYLFITSGGLPLNGAKIITDGSDYAPVSTVTITGSGFQLGEIVSNQVTQIVGPTAG